MSTTPTITQLTPTGMVVSLLDDRIAQLTAAYQAIFGPNINLDPNSFDGLALAVNADCINSIDQLAEALYQAFNPDMATGAALSLLVQLNGLTRNLGGYSSVTLRCSGTPAAVVPAGSLIASADNTTVWSTLLDGTMDSTGNCTVTAQCSVLGPVAGPAGTLTSIATPTFGWNSVTNLADASLGSSQETDAALRTRRNASTGTSAQAIIEAISGAIANVSGVTQSQVYENYTDSASVSVDNPNGLSPHSMNAVVLGGADLDIAEAIWLKRSGGLTMLGSTTQPIIDKYGNAHNIYFDRPAPIPIFVTVNIAPRSNYPTNGDALVTAAILAWAAANQTIGVDVVQSELYTPINTVAGVSISSLYIGTSASPTLPDNITIPYNQIAAFTSADIVINHV